MAEECIIEAGEIVLNDYINEIFSPKFKEYKNILGANWTFSVSVNRPFRMWTKWKTSRLDTQLHQLFHSIYRVSISCSNLPREVLVVGLFDIYGDVPIKTEQSFKNLFQEGTSSCTFEFKVERRDFPKPSKLIGKVNFYISKVNYFYYYSKSDHNRLKSEIEDNQMKGLNDLSKDFETLLQNQDLSDLDLRCGQEIFKAHKVVLSTRSPTFYAMFHNKMKENNENLVEVHDMDPKDLNLMLKYIYTGKVGQLDDLSASHLLGAAEMYQLLGLKQACAIYLECAMSNDNALSTLALADLYDENLKKRSIDYICKEFDHLRITEKWESFQKEKSILANEVLHNIIKFTHSGSSKSKE